MRQTLVLAAAALVLTTPAIAQNPAPSAALSAALNAPTRTPANKARDVYRHPGETLAFFGVEPDDVVVEALPGGGGWYTEILAPYLKDKGTLYVAQGAGKARDTLKAKLDADAATYGKVQWADFPLAGVPEGSADVVLTFRNVHNLIMNEDTTTPDRAFASFYKALKPGGVLGVVDHRLPETADSARQKTSGYLKRSTVVALAEKAGFKLAGESEVNANPKDTADWEKGVWTLPPTYRNGDVDRAKYEAIGESDRMTLKFVKPAS